MAVLLIILYFIIGGIAAAIAKDDDIGPGLVCLWPIAALILSIVILYKVFVKIGEIILGSLTYVFGLVLYKEEER